MEFVLDLGMAMPFMSSKVWKGLDVSRGNGLRNEKSPSRSSGWKLDSSLGALFVGRM